MSRNRGFRRHRWSANGQERRMMRLKVLERDGWRCQMPVCLCPDGRNIDPALTGTNEPWAPSVDHIARLTEKQVETLRNFRAAHVRCNHYDAAVSDGEAWRTEGSVGARIDAEVVRRLFRVLGTPREDG